MVSILKIFINITGYYENEMNLEYEKLNTSKKVKNQSLL